MNIDTNRVLILILLLGLLFMMYKYQQHINGEDDTLFIKNRVRDLHKVKSKPNKKLSDRELVSKIKKETKRKQPDLISIDEEEEAEFDSCDLGSLAEVNTELSVSTPKLSA